MLTSLYFIAVDADTFQRHEIVEYVKGIYFCIEYVNRFCNSVQMQTIKNKRTMFHRGVVLRVIHWKSQHIYNLAVGLLVLFKLLAISYESWISVHNLKQTVNCFVCEGVRGGGGGGC